MSDLLEAKIQLLNEGVKFKSTVEGKPCLLYTSIVVRIAKSVQEYRTKINPVFRYIKVKANGVFD